MPKFRRELGLLHDSLDFWLYFLQNGDTLDVDALPGPLTRPEISRAMEVLKVFSQSDVERDRYENRLKAQRDQLAFIRARDEAVREREEAVQEREEMARDRELAVNKLAETAKQLQQTEQQFKQSLIARIKLCERLLGQTMPAAELQEKSTAELEALANNLQQQLTG